jgi:hypothetical protein
MYSNITSDAKVSKCERKEDNKSKVIAVVEEEEDQGQGQGGRRLAGEVSKVLQLKKLGSGNYNPNVQKID